jgi:putative heme transporter
VTTQRPHNGRPHPGHGAAIGVGITWLARWSLRLIMVAAGIWLLGYLIAVLWSIVMPTLLAVILATVLWPPADWLRKHRFPPAAAAGTVMLAGMVVLAGLIAVVTTSVSNNIAEIVQSASEGIQAIRDWMAGPPLNLAQSQLDAALQQVTGQLQQSVATIASSVLAGLGGVASGVVTALLTLVLAFLFVRTQAVVSFVDAVLIGMGLVIVGVPLALPLAVLTFLGGFIPIVGAIIAGALGVLVALVSNGFTAALIVLAIIVAVQQIEGNVMQPMLQSRSLGLHAAVVLLAVTAGSTLYGIAGAFLAVPVAAAAAVVVRYLGERIDDRIEVDVASGLDEPVEEPDTPPAASSE